jgi:hypothetical protein
MSIYWVLAIFLIAAIAFGGFLLSRSKRQNQSDSHTSRAPEQSKLSSEEINTPSKISTEPEIEYATIIEIGKDAEPPIMTIAALSDNDKYVQSQKVDLGSTTTGRLLSLMQTVPQMLIAKSHHGRNLMEVEISGQLINAADGNGMRAIAKGPNGKFIEHARLFDTKNLKKLVNVSAVWQIASVVVAQKHLADITEKLEEISNNIKYISQFLDAERRSKITGAYSYLQQCAEAIRQGELSDAVRHQLEAIERDLTSVYDHLQADFHYRASHEVEHTDTFGTKELLDNIQKKYDPLSKLINDMELCLKTRALAWYVLSLYPGDKLLKDARLKSISMSLDGFRALKDLTANAVNDEPARFQSIWNTGNTLNERKQQAAQIISQVNRQLANSWISCREGLSNSTNSLLRYEEPTKIFIEINEGQITEIRMPKLIKV